MIFDADGQAFPKSPNSEFAALLKYFKKEVRDQVGFWHADKHQNFPQVDFNTLRINVFYKEIVSITIDGND